MIALIVLLTIYIASVIGAYRSIRRAYSPGGDWDILEPTLIDACVVFIPIGNSIACLIGLMSYLQNHGSHRFFRITK
jgi:hypothetical protein